MIWEQRELTLEARPRGFHLITSEVESVLPALNVGLAHVFIQHTSASLTLNENACVPSAPTPDDRNCMPWIWASE